MNNQSWKNFLTICRLNLGQGDWDSSLSTSWCTYTTFSSLKNGIHYWTCGFPEVSDLAETHIKDGSLWRQTFAYEDLAHIIIPANFYWEKFSDGNFISGYKLQNIFGLSKLLKASNIEHRVTELILEIKLY